MVSRYKRIVMFIMIISLTLGGVVAASDNITDMKNKQQEIRNSTQQARDYLNNTETEKSEVLKEVINLDILLDEAERELEQINGELDRVTEQLAQTEINLAEAEETREAQYEALKARIRYMHENGAVGYIEVLLGADSFADLINRLEYVDAIVKYDNNMAANLKATEELIVDQLAKIEKEKVEIEALQGLQIVKRQSLEEAIEEKQRAIDELTKNAATFTQQIIDLEKSDLEIQKLIREAEEAERIAREKAEQERLERERQEKERQEKERQEKERQEKERQERERQEQEKAAQAKANTAQYTGGKLGWPVAGHYTITSEYGYRIHPISKTRELHTGLDIGAPKGTSILAAADGVVIFSGYKGGYGYTIIVDHGGLTTLYAHNSKLVASVGDMVSKGDVIAKCGSTGYSTGPHCHFEVRVNGSHVDPLPYLK